MNLGPDLARMLLADSGYPQLKSYVLGSTGLAYYEDKDQDLASRMGRRLKELHLSSCREYLQLLQGGAEGDAERDRLIAELTIGETHFFRDRDQFEALRQVVLPDLLERNRVRKRLRIWSAGCSTGPEPYSVAILLKRDYGHLLGEWDVSILATDINRTFLARAREARFEEWDFRSAPGDLKDSCFRREGASWVLARPYRECVSFQCHNLVQHPFPSLIQNLCSFDLILCRNVMIYFSGEITRRLLDQFHQTLVAGGWLLVGHAEHNLEYFGAFRSVRAPGTTLYQKPGAGAFPARPFPHELWSRPPAEKMPASSTHSRPVSSPPAPPAPETVPQRSGTDAVRDFADRGEWERAATACEALLSADRLDPRVHFYHALVLEQLGRKEEAERCLKRALYLDRGFTLAHYHLGLLLQKQGEMRRAARSFENVLHLLAKCSPGERFADADGLTAADLEEITRVHLEVFAGS